MFLDILLTVILPIFLVMALGYWLAKSYQLHTETLSKLNFYILMPIFMFENLVLFKPTTSEVLTTVGFQAILACFTFCLTVLVMRMAGFKPSLEPVAILAAVVFNSANYGIPVVELAFQKEGTAIQIVTITALNVITYTFGILVVGGWGQWKKGLLIILKLPILYALFLALAVRAWEINLPLGLMSALKWVADGMLPIALLTLGIQLAKDMRVKISKELVLTCALRLIGGPLLAFGIIHLMGLHGLLARVLFVSSAFPTAVITVLFGIEYGKEPKFAADTVLATTLLSALTVTAAIALSTVLF